MDREEALETLRRQPDGGKGKAPRERRRWPWAVLGVVVVVIVVIVLLWWFSRTQAVAVETFTVATPAASTSRAALSASGYVVARERATVSSKITGMVHKVLVTEGEHVKEGQLVAILDDSSETTRIRRAQAALAADKARVAQAQANLRQAKLALKRRRELVNQHMVSQAAVDKAIAEAQSAKAAVKAAKAQVAVDRARLKTAKLRKQYTRITAPFSGVVTQVYAHPGEMISPGAVGGFTKTGICGLVNMDSLEIEVDVNENYLKRLKPGMPAEVALSAYPGERFDAHVTEIVPVVNRAQATVEVHLAFEKLDPRILPGMQAQVFFYSAKSDGKPETAAPVIRIPDSAVRHDTQGDYVYEVANGRLQGQSVRVRQLPGSKVIVISGLTGGERIVTGSNAALHPGMLVQTRGGSH